MKINFLLPGIPIGGGPRVVFEYANRLSNRGHSVTVLYPLIPAKMEESWFTLRPRASQALGAIERLMERGRVDWFDLDVPVQPIPTLAPNLIEYFEGLIPDADITIATAWQTAYAVASLDETKGEKAYFIQHYEIWNTWNSDEAWEQVSSLTHNPACYPVEMCEITPKSDKARREKELVDRTYKLSLSKITISSWLSELLQTKFDEDVVDRIPNSVNHSTFYPDPTTRSESLSLLLPYRNAPWKGQREARELINEFQSADIQINTFGSGDESDLPEYVDHHSGISDDELRHLYSNSDIFVLTAWTEGFGLPPLEAMACKSAVIATNVGAVSDYAEDGETAIIVPPRDSEALIEAVEELIQDRGKRRRLQKQGVQSTNEYTWGDATAKYEEALEEIAISD